MRFQSQDHQTEQTNENLKPFFRTNLTRNSFYTIHQNTIFQCHKTIRTIFTEYNRKKNIYSPDTQLKKNNFFPLFRLVKENI